MKAIYKYPVHHGTGYGFHKLSIRVDMAKGAKIISAILQTDNREQVGNTKMYIYAVVDPSQPIVERTILVAGTGMTFNDVTFENKTFIGTVQREDGYVWHLFDVGEEK